MAIVVTYGENVLILFLILFILAFVPLLSLKLLPMETALLLVAEIMIAPLIINVVTQLPIVKNYSASQL
jgi:hypothetical protein